VTLDPERILKDLSELWTSLAAPAQEGAQGAAAVLRACSMTLIVAAEEAEDPGEIGEILAALMPEHPSRAIVVRVGRGENLAARVFEQCWMPFGGRRQICCEQIEIRGDDQSLGEIAGVVLPLVVPDLPVILWCRSPRLYNMAGLPELSALAHKLVLDSARFADPIPILARLAESPLPPGDLAWARLTRWRALIAQVFDNQAYLAKLPQVSDVRVSYFGARPSASAFYMSAWLLDGLQKAGSRPKLALEAVEDSPARGLREIELTAAEGGVELLLRLADGHAAEVRVDGVISRAALPEANEYALLREELAIPRRDPVYERTLERASRLAAGFA